MPSRAIWLPSTPETGGPASGSGTVFVVTMMVTDALPTPRSSSVTVTVIARDPTLATA